MFSKKQKIIIRTIIELLGKPKDHVEKTIKLLVAKLKGEKGIIIKNEFISESISQEELFSIYTELELEFESIELLSPFVFNYMPSLIEILEPEEIKLTARDFTNYLTDLQLRLHQIDGTLKLANQEKMNMNSTIVTLAKNNIVSALRLEIKNGLNKQKISEFTGIVVNDLDQILNLLIKDNKILVENDNYKINLSYDWVNNTKK